jgi:hypothetical protein
MSGPAMGGQLAMGGLIDYFRIPGKSRREREFLVMRGLVMALFALDVPGNGGSLKANHWAGRIGVPFLSSSTKAKTITKTTGKTV